MNIIQAPSPNRQTSTYEKIGVQIHKTLGLMPSTLTWLRSPRSQASAHYLITKQGFIYQMVQLKDRAWAAGRITKNTLSPRAKNIMLKDWLGRYVKPGHYLIQVEFECLLNETYTEKQYEAAVWLFKTFPFQINAANLLTHRDTASDKPDLEEERKDLLKRLGTNDSTNIQKAIALVEDALALLKQA